MQCALAERDGVLRGYARYAVRPRRHEEGAGGEVLLRNMEALDPAAHAAMLRYLFHIDLTSRLHLGNRPVDDPLLYLASDVRRCRTAVRDGLHLRLVDVGEALRARTYAAPVDVVLDVQDACCPWNAGRWRLSGDADGASCERTGDPADLAVSVRDPGAVHLGGTSLSALTAAGRVRELRHGASARAAVAFRGDVAPWLPHGF